MKRRRNSWPNSLAKNCNFMNIFRKAKANTRENVRYQLRDKDGNIKQLFAPNWLFVKLLKLGWAKPTSRSWFLGSFQDSMVISNLVTNAGMAGVAGRINGSGSPAAFTYIAIGTGVVAADPTDTTLGTESSGNGADRAAATVSLVTTDVANDTARLVKTFTFTGSFALTESGIFNAASTGTLLARQVFSAINVISGDSLQITWDIDVDTV